MEQDRYSGSGPDPGLCGCDRDLFQRVWRRVMPEEVEGCPIELSGAQDSSLAVSNGAAHSFAPPASGGRTKGYMEISMPCLGAASGVYGAQLQKFIRDELSDWKAYQALALRAGTGAMRVLSGISSDEYRHAKRLSAAYFLISGARYWPNAAPHPQPENFLDALRRRFGAEHRGEAEYLAAAAETNDPCLHELYLELAGDEAGHARLIRSLLEQRI